MAPLPSEAVLTWNDLGITLSPTATGYNQDVIFLSVQVYNQNKFHRMVIPVGRASEELTTILLTGPSCKTLETSVSFITERVVDWLISDSESRRVVNNWALPSSKELSDSVTRVFVDRR